MWELSTDWTSPCPDVYKRQRMPSDPRLWLMVGIIVGAVSIATAISGIQKAMTKISNINVYGFARCV